MKTRPTSGIYATVIADPGTIYYFYTDEESKCRQAMGLMGYDDSEYILEEFERSPA